MKKTILLIISFIILVACQANTPPQSQTEQNGQTAEVITIKLMTHDSFEISQEVIAQFETENNIKVEIFKAGDGGAILNQAILAKDNPLADVLFGIDNTFLSRAIEQDIFMPYQSPALANIPDTLKLDPENRALPVDYGDVCLNYDKAWFTEHNLTPPQTLDDLINPAYSSLTVVENPATSTPGLAFLLTTISYFGEDKYLEYWQQLVNNDVMVVNGWEDAYWGQFSAASDGERPIVVSYASSPPAEVYFADPPIEEAPTAAVVSDGTCFRQIEFVGILKGSEHVPEAQKLIDFMLSKTFQEDIPLNMFVYPANQTVTLPEVFVKFSQTPNKTANPSPTDIATNREAWLEAWTETVLR